MLSVIAEKAAFEFVGGKKTHKASFVGAFLSPPSSPLHWCPSCWVPVHLCCLPSSPRNCRLVLGPNRTADASDSYGQVSPRAGCDSPSFKYQDSLELSLPGTGVPRRCTHCFSPLPLPQTRLVPNGITSHRHCHGEERAQGRRACQLHGEGGTSMRCRDGSLLRSRVFPQGAPLDGAHARPRARASRHSPRTQLRLQWCLVNIAPKVQI